MAVERGDNSVHAVLEIGRLAGSVVPIDQEFPSMLEAIGRVFAATAVILREHHADRTLCVRAAWSDPARATESVGARDDGAAQCAAEWCPLSAHVLASDGLVDELFATAGDHALEAFSPGERRPLEASLPARVALEDRPFLADDLPSDPRIAGDAYLVVPRNARSWLSVPLRANGRAFGALNFSARAPAVYTEADIPLAQQIADQLATYLDLVRLHRQERHPPAAAERARLAPEIHDTLTQDLSLLVLQLQALERTAGLPPSVQAEVAATTEQAHLLLQEDRRSVWDLAPSPLEGRDLATALEEELDRFCEGPQ